MSRPSDQDWILQLKNLKKYFPIQHGLLRRTVGHVKAVDDVSVDVRRGEVLGLVGESGCGKTTVGRLILRGIEPTGGKILFRCDDRAVDLAGLNRREMRRMRPELQMVFQDPYASLNPRMTIADIVGEPLVVNGWRQGRALRDRVAKVLADVGLDAQYMSRYPHAFSGGQRQRIGIARAIILEPSVLVADEPVSALDVSIQAQVLNLLSDLQADYQMTYIFISHDLGVIDYLCHRVVVMYVGKFVEIADTETLFTAPRHPYVEALLRAVPRVEPGVEVPLVGKGEVADPANRPPGCSFHPRCPYAVELCRQEEPLLKDVTPDGSGRHWAACHRSEELSLQVS